MSRKISPKKFLRDYRKANNLSANDVARKLSSRERRVSASLVFAWENGTREVTADNAVLMEKKLGLDRARFRPELFERAVA